jgi:hypothetical protein
MPDNNQNDNNEPVEQDGQTLQSAYSAEADISLSLSESIANDIDTEILASLFQNGMTSRTYTFNSVSGLSVDTINVTIPMPQAEPEPTRSQRVKIAVLNMFFSNNFFDRHIETVRRIPRISSVGRGWIHYHGGWFPIIDRLETGLRFIAIEQESLYDFSYPMAPSAKLDLMRRDGAFEPDPWGNVRYYEEDYNDRT